MGSFFTAIGKILNIRFLLIFLSIIFYVDLYFILKLKVSFIQNYQDYLNLNEILLIIISYLITLNIIIPLLAFLFSILGVLINFAILYSNIKWLENISNFISNDDLENLLQIEKDAIKNNNSALMKSYELKLEKYNELHSIYLFSFFILIELLQLLHYESFSTQLVMKTIELLSFTGDQEIFSILFLWLPGLLLLLFSFRYISSFKAIKIFNWIGGIDYEKIITDK